MTNLTEHDVRTDTVKTLEGEFERVTCHTDGCHMDCRVRQKWMGDDQWLDILFRFGKIHPFALSE